MSNYTEILDKVKASFSEAGREITAKTGKAAEMVKLRTRISTCDEVIEKTYAEIGRLYYKQHAGDPSSEYSKQLTAIKNALEGKEKLEAELKELKASK